MNPKKIKFRGRNKSSIWYHGDLIHENDGTMFIAEDCSFKELYNYLMVNTCTVDEETVGQYIGINDKDGVEVYEGDIVRTTKGEILLVTFDPAYFRFVFSTEDFKYIPILERIFEVIGNRFDNPKLFNYQKVLV